MTLEEAKVIYTPGTKFVDEEGAIKTVADFSDIYFYEITGNIVISTTTGGTRYVYIANQNWTAKVIATTQLYEIFN